MTAPVLTRPSPMRQGPESPAQSAKLHSESGFTLAEMLVMAFVMAVCLAIAYPRLRGSWMAASLRSDAQGL